MIWFFDFVQFHVRISRHLNIYIFWYFQNFVLLTKCKAAAACYEWDGARRVWGVWLRGRRESCSDEARYKDASLTTSPVCLGCSQESCKHPLNTQMKRLVNPSNNKSEVELAVGGYMMNSPSSDSRSWRCIICQPYLQSVQCISFQTFYRVENASSMSVWHIRLPWFGSVTWWRDFVSCRRRKGGDCKGSLAIWVWLGCECTSSTLLVHE